MSLCGSRASRLASVSSVTVDEHATFGMFGSSIFGRWKSPGAADEKPANATSKTSGSQSGSIAQYGGMENKRDVSVEESQIILDEATAKHFETNALRRLQRETFEELMRVRERLDKLEFHTGLRKSQAQSPSGAAKTQLKGKVNTGGAFLLLDDKSSRYSRAALEEADFQTGLNARFTFETLYRERDVMITECSAGHSDGDGNALGGPISVSKLVYNARVTDDLDVVVAPVGACGCDITETVNPLQGQALTKFARLGPAMYQSCVGSAVGATLKGKLGFISLSQYLSGWGTGSSLADAPLSLSTLAHVLFQPWENSVFSLSAVNRFMPNLPRPSVRGLHWSEMGPLILSRTRHADNSGSISPQMSGSPGGLRTSMDDASMRDFRTVSIGNSSTSPWGTPYGEAEQAVSVPGTLGRATQSVALAGEIDVGANVSLAGWAQADLGRWSSDSEEKEIEWGMSLTKAVGKEVDWGLCVGSSKVRPWSASRNEDNTGTGDHSGDMLLHMEAFMNLSVGRGFTLQPGLVYLLNKQSQTPALMLRSSWAL